MIRRRFGDVNTKVKGDVPPKSLPLYFINTNWLGSTVFEVYAEFKASPKSRISAFCDPVSFSTRVFLSQTTNSSWLLPPFSKRNCNKSKQSDTNSAYTPLALRLTISNAVLNRYIRAKGVGIEVPTLPASSILSRESSIWFIAFASIGALFNQPSPAASIWEPLWSLNIYDIIVVFNCL